jgi:hypothetical protein
MANKLVVIINSFKIATNYENFTIWNEISCTKLQLPPEPLTRGLPSPRSPFSVSSVLNWICWIPPEQNSWVRYWFWQYCMSLKLENIYSIFPHFLNTNIVCIVCSVWLSYADVANSWNVKPPALNETAPKAAVLTVPSTIQTSQVQCAHICTAHYTVSFRCSDFQFQWQIPAYINGSRPIFILEQKQVQSTSVLLKM